MNAVYTRFEFIRLFRNRQNVVFTLVIPLVMFFAIAGANRNVIIDTQSGLKFPRFYMSGMIAFGTLAATLAGGARIAAERGIGCTRQLRLTPLPPQTYVLTKVFTFYLMAIISLLLLTVAGLVMGVTFPGGQWPETAGLVLIALIPFAALGVMLGHLIKEDSMGPVIGGGVSLFTMVGGGYFPLGINPGVTRDIVQLVPSYWLVQAGRIGVGGLSWTWVAWLVVAVWGALAIAGAAWAYQRDTRRA